MSDIDHVHPVYPGVETIILTPSHDPRQDTEAYRQSHQRLVIELDSPCEVCGVRNSTLTDPAQNPLGAHEIHTHHHPIERSLVNACSIDKVGAIFPQVVDQESLEAFIDSEHNLMVLCDECHIGPHGVHRLPATAFAASRFLKPGYRLTTDQAHLAQDEAQDEQVLGESAG